MPVADYKTYCQMVDRALTGKFAYPAFNVPSMTTASAVLRGLAESKSDGIIQVSTGGGGFAAGSMWGQDLTNGQRLLTSGAWWAITFPGIMIILLALGSTLMGEGLSEILNPRLEQ